MSITKNTNLFLPIVKIYYALADDISSINDIDNEMASVTFDAGKDWSLLYASRDSIVFNESQKDVNEGVVYDQTLEFKNPGDDNSNNITLVGLANKKIVIRLDYINGESKLFGSLTNPCKILNSYKYSDLNTARQIKIIRQSDIPIPYLGAES
jgi:hypothetical protein